MFEISEELYQTAGAAVPASVTSHGIVARQLANGILTDPDVQRLVEASVRMRLSREVSARLIDALPEGYAPHDVAYLAALVEELIEEPAAEPSAGVAAGTG